MSGLLAVWNRHDKPIEHSTVSSMLSRMNRRGPDRSQVWVKANVGMGHALLATTPEAKAEILPLEDYTSGALVITADARLDNRSTLAANLSLTDMLSKTGDGELILKAYQRWGTDCVDHLLGDFAFVIWDPQKQKMFCARDHFGMKQMLYSASPGRHFACATDAEALLASPDIPRQINRSRILDCLTDHLESLDESSTMFSNIFRLPPGHKAQITKENITITRYWQMEPPEQLHLNDDREYADAFLDIFNQAVKARLRGNDEVGAMLSGGLDSNSVVSSACELLRAKGLPPITTISAIGNEADANCLETRAILASIRGDHRSAHTITPQEMEKLAPAMLQHIHDLKEPFDGNMNMIRAVYHRARSKGKKVVLDGVGGDAAMDIGSYTKRLIKQGHPFAAWEQLKSENRFWGQEQTGLGELTRIVISTFLPNGVRQWRGRRAVRYQASDIISDIGIAPDFAAQENLHDKLHQFRRYGGYDSWHDPQKHAVRVFNHPNETVARERYDRVGAEYGIETRDPFRDIRVAKFCASLPSSQKSKNGWPKYILRQAFGSKFPSEIRQRMGKEDLGWAYTDILIKYARSESQSSERQLKATLEPYCANVDQINLYSDEWFYLAHWLVSQNAKI